MKTRAASLRQPRRALIDRCATLRRKHRARSAEVRRLKQITHAMLRAELREAARAASPAPAEAAPDLFTL